jgi:hypothetical protein
MFKTSENAFTVTFANGWSVTVAWSSRNYCENHMRAPDKASAECADAEVFLRKDGKVQGEPRAWQTPEEVAALLAEAATYA